MAWRVARTPVGVSGDRSQPRLKPLEVTEMLRAATLLLLLAVCTGYSFRVCGNYCGPGWCTAARARRGCCRRIPCSHCAAARARRCNAQWEKEEVCDDSADTDGSCEDACCRLHDTCCGHKTPSTGKADCNTAIVTCLDACSGDKVSKWCRDGLDIPISNRVIADAMDLVEGWCCGGPCPKAGDDETPHAALAALAPNRSGSILVEERRHNASVEAIAKPLAAGQDEAVGVEGEVGAEPTVTVA